MVDFLTVQGPTPNSYAPPKVDSSWVGDLYGDYAKGQQYGRLRQLQTMFQPGTPGGNALASGNYSALFPMLAAAGGADTVSQLLPGLMGQQTMDAARQQASGGGQLAPLQGQPTSSAQPTSGGNDVGSLLKGAIYGQESSSGKNIRTSATGNVGPMQISPSLFAANAQPGEDINDPIANKTVGDRILDKYLAKYNGDWRRAAVAYYSGEGNVAPPGSPTPWKTDRSPRPGVPGPSTSGYVAQVGAKMARLAGTQTAAASPGPGAPSPGTQPTGPTPGTAAAESPQPGAPGAPPSTAAVGTAPLVPRETSGQPPGPAPPPFMGGTNSANPQGPTPPQQTAQAASPAPAQAPPQEPGGPVPPGYTAEHAKQLLDSAANKEKAASYSAGKVGVPKEFVEQLRADAANDREQGQKINDFLADRSKQQYGAGIERQKELFHVNVARSDKLRGGIEAAARQYEQLGDRDGLQLARGILNNPAMWTGVGAERSLDFNRVRAAFGDAKTAQLQEMLQKVTAQNVLSDINTQRDQMGEAGLQGGRMFQQQAELVNKASAQLGTTLAGNRALVEIKIRNGEMASKLAQMERDYLRTHDYLDTGFDQKVSDEFRDHPIYRPTELAHPELLGVPTAPSTLRSKDDYTNWGASVGLKPGDPYRTSTGNLRPLP